MRGVTAASQSWMTATEPNLSRRSYHPRLADRDHIDEARLRPHLRQSQPPSRNVQTSPVAKVTYVATTPQVAGGDHIRMRGIPVQAKGVTSTAPGTNPEQALIQRENRKERRQ